MTPTAAAPLRRPGDDAQLAACASDEPSFLAPYVVNRTCMVNYSKLASETPKYYFRNEFYCLFSSLKCHQFFISINFVTQLFDFKVPPIHKQREKGETRHPRTARGPQERKSGKERFVCARGSKKERVWTSLRSFFYLCSSTSFGFFPSGAPPLFLGSFLSRLSSSFLPSTQAANAAHTSAHPPTAACAWTPPPPLPPPASAPAYGVLRRGEREGRRGPRISPLPPSLPVHGWGSIPPQNCFSG